MPTSKILGFKKLSWKKKIMYIKNLIHVPDQFLPVSQDVQVEKVYLIYHNTSMKLEDEILYTKNLKRVRGQFLSVRQDVQVEKMFVVA